MKDWHLSFDDGVTGGRFKDFWSLSSAIKYAMEHIYESNWIYIDNSNIKELKRLYIKVPKGHWTENQVIIKSEQDEPASITSFAHVNPNCKDSTLCKPHGETGPVEHQYQIDPRMSSYSLPLDGDVHYYCPACKEQLLGQPKSLSTEDFDNFYENHNKTCKGNANFQVKYGNIYNRKPELFVCHYCKKCPTPDAPLFRIACITWGTYFQHVPPCEANKDKIMPDGKPVHHDISFCECECHTKGSPQPKCAKCNCGGQ